nr:hypothetical protein Itr_chr04CG18450 [Ipomoea trifida]
MNEKKNNSQVKIVAGCEVGTVVEGDRLLGRLIPNVLISGNSKADAKSDNGGQLPGRLIPNVLISDDSVTGVTVVRGTTLTCRSNVLK